MSVCLSVLSLLRPLPLPAPHHPWGEPHFPSMACKTLQSAFSLSGEMQFFFLFWGTVNSSLCLKSCSLPNRPYAYHFTPLQSVVPLTRMLFLPSPACRVCACPWNPSSCVPSSMTLFLSFSWGGSWLLHTASQNATYHVVITYAFHYVLVSPSGMRLSSVLLCFNNTQDRAKNIPYTN